MRHFLSCSLILFLVWTASSQSVRKLSSFTKVSAQEGISVLLKSGNEESAKIVTKGIDEREVLTEVNGSTLKIHLEDNNYRNIDVKVYVTYKQLTSLKASSAATIDVEDKVLASGGFEIDCSSSGEIEVEVTAAGITIEASSSGAVDAKVESNSLDVKVSSSGDIDIAGKVNEVEITASSSGDFNGYNLASKGAKLRASSGASINITVTESIEARASSGGSIQYKGSPSYTTKDTSSGGSVRKS